MHYVPALSAMRAQLQRLPRQAHGVVNVQRAYSKNDKRNGSENPFRPDNQTADAGASPKNPRKAAIDRLNRTLVFDGDNDDSLRHSREHHNRSHLTAAAKILDSHPCKREELEQERQQAQSEEPAAVRLNRLLASLGVQKSKAKTKQELQPEVKQQEQPAAADSGKATRRLNAILASFPNKSDEATHDGLIPRPNLTRKAFKDEVKRIKASKDITVAAKQVASLHEQPAEQQRTESELLHRLLVGTKAEELETAGIDEAAEQAAEKAPPIDENASLSDLLAHMNIDRRPVPSGEETRSDYVRQMLNWRKQLQQKQGGVVARQSGPGAQHVRIRQAHAKIVDIPLWHAQPLGIFATKTADESPEQAADMLDTWTHCQEAELKMLVTHPPSNYYYKLARWTEEGKLWRFPIDNEQDIGEEANVDFSQHICLEQYLEPWCPKSGPVLHFMSLVCVGLSKNPYITAKQKKEHILYYRDYFESKKELLERCLIDEADAGTEQEATTTAQLAA